MFLHVAFGAAWTIIDLFLGLVLGPVMAPMPVPARIHFQARLMPKLVLIMPTVVAVTLAAGWQLGVHMGTVDSSYYNHQWLVASYIVVGVMAVIALGLLESANIVVLYELKRRTECTERGRFSLSRPGRDSPLRGSERRAFRPRSRTNSR